MNSDDYWSTDEFEDNVGRALIAGFESKIVDCKGTGPDKLKPEHLARMRSAGLFIPAKDRVVADGSTFDVDNDKLPVYATFSAALSAYGAGWGKGAYLQIITMRQCAKTHKYWKRRTGGTLYEQVCVIPNARGISGSRGFVTVTRDGAVIPCDLRAPDAVGYNQPGVRRGFIEHDAAFLDGIAMWGSLTLQYWADKRHTWTITARDRQSKAILGCREDEVKSLLYSRTVPLTESGRKRPIMHLVSAHKRRMKNGTNVDITQFMRGTQVVEIGGTEFTVKAPIVKYSDVSENSRLNYEWPDGVSA